ncbi:putative bifunctional diguanylate cyclase/phosphodiesterase [Pulveribacter suum]|uniref:GGDEF domain-containing protein n=1 Tax=Pulveribacter suum TaxID=2116657 RepID=A0A2P1NMQ8_9BURK|nr:EAL domain-containing protein [Pulveribacter suum]AVP58339.1 GGDEF domain-containing protein [Pulveribacter suum]
MNTARIAWIDPDAAHARRALGLLALSGQGWLALQVPHPQFGAAPARGWSAVVLCLAAQAGELPDWAGGDGGGPDALLLCVWPQQEGLAARALRAAARAGRRCDYLLRSASGDHVPELLQRLGALLQEPSVPGVAEPSDVRQQLACLQTALASMSQGIFQTGPDGRINVYNRRVLELLELPEALLARRPTLAELTQVQTRRGDYGQDFGLIDERARDYVRGGAAGAAPAVYRRHTLDGRTLEVRTQALPDGGLVRTFADVSDYVRVHAELQRSEARFRSLCDLSSDWYWEQDAEGRFTDIAGVAAHREAWLQALHGRTLSEAGAANMGESDWAAHREHLGARQPFRELELKRVSPGGEVSWIALSGEPVVSARGTLLGYRGVGRDISGRKRAEAEIERLAFYDALTGLPNRRLLLDRLQRSCAGLQRSRSHSALLFIDLDHFKNLNDNRGHDVGDRLLCMVARRLRQCVRASDTVARFGGDEFVVLVDELKGEPRLAREGAQRLARKIASALAQPFPLEGGYTHHTTCSMGLTLFSYPAQSADELLKQADFAMYQAKAAGRNALRLFDPGVLAQMRARTELETELRHGLARGELLLHYQPVVNAAGTITGAEALVRWQHPTRGLVAPGEFIALAEQTGLILPLGRWVLETACMQLATWAAQPAMQSLVVSVNVSARQFRQSEFANQVLAALRASGARPQALRLELTESLLLTDTEEMIAKMEQLRAQGVGFSLDDFGTGYSSLSYLKRLPLDQLKIDRGFVRDVLIDGNDAAIVRTILGLARSLDLQVVAEGVETASQLDFLRRHGCQAFQGYLFGRPAPAAMLELAMAPVPA